MSTTDFSRPADKEQSRCFSSKTRKRLTKAAAIVAGVLPLVPGSALAQDYRSQTPGKPDLVGTITTLEAGLKARTNNDPRYIWFEPSIVARNIGQICTGFFSGDGGLDGALKLRTSSNAGSTKVSVTYTQVDGMANAALGHKDFVTSGPSEVPTGFTFNCNWANTDSITARMMKRSVIRHGARKKLRYTRYRAFGPVTNLLPTTVNYNILPAGSTLDTISFSRGDLTANRSLTKQNRTLGLYGVEIMRETSSPYSPGSKYTIREVIGPLHKRTQTLDAPDHSSQFHGSLTK